MKTARALEEGSGIVIEIDAAKIDPANEGKLVHISGDAIAAGRAVRHALRRSAPKGAVQPHPQGRDAAVEGNRREVERTGNDGKTMKTTVYDYEQVWSSTPIDSSSFKTASAPQEPAMPLSGDNFDIIAAKVGAFRIAGNAVAPLGQEDAAARCPKPASSRRRRPWAAHKPMWLVNNQYLFGSRSGQRRRWATSASAIERGDVSRVSAWASRATAKSCMPYTTSNGREVFLIQAGRPRRRKCSRMRLRAMSSSPGSSASAGWCSCSAASLSFSPLTVTLGRVAADRRPVRGGASLVGVVMTLLLGSRHRHGLDLLPPAAGAGHRGRRRRAGRGGGHAGEEEGSGARSTGSKARA